MSTVRASTPEDLDAVLGVVTVEPVGGVDPDRYTRELGTGSYRPEWTWLALDGAAVVGRAVWWGHPGAAAPSALDCLRVDGGRVDVAAQLLRAGHEALGASPDLEVDVAPGWREDPDAVAALAWREAAAGEAGLTHRLERLSVTWTPDAGGPSRRG